MLRQAINRLGTFNKCLAFVWPARFAARSQVRESRQTRFEVFCMGRAIFMPTPRPTMD